MSGLSVPAETRWGMGDAVAGILASLVLPSVVIGLAGLTGDEVDRLALWAVLLLQLPLWIALLGAPVLASRAKGTGSLRRDFGLEMRGSDIVVGVVVGVAAQLVLTLALIPLYHLLGVDPDDVGRAATDLADRAPDLARWVWLFLLVVAGAPFFEELFYRGLLLRSIARRWGDAAGIVTSGLVFSALHFERLAAPALAVFGMVLAWLARRTGRLGPSIWAHVGFNLTTFVGLVLSR